MTLPQKTASNNPVFIYFSQLIEKPVVDRSGAYAGRLWDIIVRSGEIYPVSSACVVKRPSIFGSTYAVVDWKDVASLDTREITIGVSASELKFLPGYNRKEETSLKRDILDQQVVDTYNHNVIRVNDIHMLAVDNALLFAHVDIGFRGIVRRLGFERQVDAIVRFANARTAYLTDEHLIAWKNVHPLNINPVSMTLKIDVPQKKFSSIPAADLGEIFLDLDFKQKHALFKSLDLQNKARIFINIDFKDQESLMEELNDAETIEILKAVPSDEATDFLEKLPKKKVDHLLGLMENAQSRKLSQLLGYSGDSAGGLMVKEFLSFTKTTTVAEVLKHIKEKSPQSEAAQFVFIVDETGKLLSSTSFRRLIQANPEDTLAKTAYPKAYSVTLDSSVKEVAYLMEKYKYAAIAVVDDNHVLQGIITVDDILSQLVAIAWRRLRKIKPPSV